jgi:hypothetical protein
MPTLTWCFFVFNGDTLSGFLIAQANQGFVWLLFPKVNKIKPE